MPSGGSSWVIGRLRSVRGFVRSYDPGVWDGWIALVFAVLAFVPQMGTVGAEYGDLPRRPMDVFAIVLMLAQTLPLVLRTRQPRLCLAVIGVAFGIAQAMAYPTNFGSIGFYVALYSAAAHLERGRRITASLAAAGYALLIISFYVLGTKDPVLDFVVMFVMLSLFWVVGAFVRQRRLDEAERRRLAEVAATVAERARIARELHDVVTHHVTAMVVQADATQFLTSSPDRVEAALNSIGGTGRRALTELRFLLNVLEATGDQPARRTPRTLRTLVEQTREGGQPVELVEDGDEPDLPADVGLVVYRVVQEALTNAVKYATGKPTQVRVGYRPDAVDVEVTTLGPTAAPVVLSAVGAGAPDLPGGRGLAGLRQRVGALGGELTAGEQPEGRFRVHALIPTGSDT